MQVCGPLLSGTLDIGICWQENLKKCEGAMMHFRMLVFPGSIPVRHFLVSIIFK